MSKTFQHLILIVFVIITSCSNENPTKVNNQVVIPPHYIEVPDYYPYIQMALNNSENGDTIIVKPGIYYENIDFVGKDIVLSSLFLLSNNKAHICSTRINGSQNGRSVVGFKNGEGKESVLIGFTIQNGNTDYGGGIYIRDSSPTLEHLNIIGNSVERTGGGIYITGESNPIINSVIIEENLADVGAGISARYSSFTLNNAVVNRNSAITSGGGIQCTLTKKIFINNSIISNNDVTEVQGGGIYLSNIDSVLLNNVSVTANRAQQGGGIYSGSAINFQMTNSVINNNTSDSQGGGVFSVSGSYKFVSTLIYRNNASEGGGISCVTSDMLLENVTLCDNVAEEIGGIYVYGILTIANSIVWGNSGSEIECATGQVTVLYSDIENGQDSIRNGDIRQIQWLEGNTDLEPNFINTDSANFHLLPDSPCIDAGINLYVVDGDTVIDIAPDEFIGDAPDMGAFEFVE
ncbi:MAG: choice-of-anchor Q domain-containing protein [Candidatus Hatepunaea meridiana]|nr:choice-of-anchor Q domain-containing protein [Candidatus Hatepunaea meridiana]